MVEVWPLGKELDRPFDDPVNDGVISDLNASDLLIMKERDDGIVESLWILIWVLSQLFVNFVSYKCLDLKTSKP
jgi:hypothetical protein